MENQTTSQRLEALNNSMNTSLSEQAVSNSGTEVISVVKRGRGRPSTKKNDGTTPVPIKIITVSEPSDRATIEDELLSPYKIVITENSYNVVDQVRPEGAIADNPYGYYTNLTNALIKITRLKTNKNKAYSLKGYIDEVSGMLNEFKAKFQV